MPKKKKVKKIKKLKKTNKAKLSGKSKTPIKLTERKSTFQGSDDKPEIKKIKKPPT